MNNREIEIIKNDCEEVSQILSDSAKLLKSSKILITGGTGFMGKWLTEVISFLNDNYDFNIKLYLLSRYAYDFKSSASHLVSRSDVTLISNDISNVYELPEEINYIIHAAGSPDNRLNATDPLRVTRTVVNGTAALLDTASRLPNLYRIVNVSSGLIYGSQPYEMDKISEIYLGGPDTNSAMSAYIESKRMAEVLCSIYRTQQRMDIITVRPYAFMGPYQLIDKPWALNNFIRDSINGGPIRILGNENTVRSYMYASDMAYWVLTILANGQSGKVYNIGSSESLSLKKLAEKITSIFRSKIEISYETPPNKLADQSIFVPDTEFAEKSLGLKRFNDLDKGLTKTIQWYIGKQ